MISIMTDMSRLFDKCNLPRDRQIHGLCDYRFLILYNSNNICKNCAIHEIKSPCWLHQNCSTGCAGLF